MNSTWINPGKYQRPGSGQPDEHDQPGHDDRGDAGGEVRQATMPGRNAQRGRAASGLASAASNSREVRNVENQCQLANGQTAAQTAGQ